MALSYSDFKTYVLNKLWRSNDTYLANNLDNIIREADAELKDLTFDWEARQKSVAIAPETQDFDLTANVADFEFIRSLTNNKSDTIYFRSKKTFVQTTPSEIYDLRAKQADLGVYPSYAVLKNNDNHYLLLVGPFSAEDPGDLQLVYRRTIPDYAAEDASWIEDEYFNLYVSSVLKQAAIFVREDERIETYSQMQTAALTAGDTADKHGRQFGGSPLHMKPHRVVP